MINYHLVKSKFFIVFLAISAMAFSAIPFVRKALAEASDTYVKERMHRVQAELYFYDLSQNIRSICVGGEISLLQHELILESSKGLSCTIDERASSLSFYTELKRTKQVYCVDTFGYKGFIENSQPIMLGRCSK